jgi:hypothetical protein
MKIKGNNFSEFSNTMVILKGADCHFVYIDILAEGEELKQGFSLSSWLIFSLSPPP